MGIEHLAAVLDHSRKGGSCLVVLLVVASYSDQNGEWVADQATLQRRTHLRRRRVQQVLDELVAAGDLAVIPGDGRGRRSTYRLTIGPERAKQSAPFPEKGEAGCTLSAQKGAAECTLSPQKGAAECTLSAQKGAAECTLSPQKGAAECTLSPQKGAAECALSAPLSPPFLPHPPIPLNPPEKQETFGLRPLSGPQGAVFRVNLLLEEAGVPLPSPAQIGLWSKTLGGIEPLLELLGRLVQSGLANKREPIAYVHRVVLERAARPEPARPAKPVNPLRTAGVDEIRRRQAARIAGRPWPGEGGGE